MIDPTTGLLLLPARSYDPTQGRFTSRDTANVFNKYQGFSTNPISNVDTTGEISLGDLFIDIGIALVFAVTAIATAGAAVAALPALVGAEVGAVTATAVVTTVAEAVTAVASATGAVASLVKAANDGDQVVNGRQFLTADQRATLGTVQMVAGAVAAVSGLAAIGSSAAGAIAEGAAQDADTFLTGAGDDAGAANQDNATGTSWWSRLFGGAKSEVPNPYDNVENVNVELFSDSDEETVAAEQPAVRDTVNGISGNEVQPKVTPASSRLIPPGQNVVRTVVGSDTMTASDGSVFDEDPEVTTAVKTQNQASELSESEDDEATQPTPDSPQLNARDYFRQQERLAKARSWAVLRAQWEAEDPRIGPYG
jgi:hypothetical protein